MSERSFISIGGCDKIIRNVTDMRVSDGASRKLVDILLDYAEKIAIKAGGIAKHSGRKTIKEGDIELSIN